MALKYAAEKYVGDKYPLLQEVLEQRRLSLQAAYSYRVAAKIFDCSEARFRSECEEET